MNSFTTVIYTFQGVKTYNNWTVHEYKCLFLTFIFLRIEREREREWYIKFRYKGKMSPKLLIFFSTGFHWRIVLLSRANRLCSVFNTGLKDLGSFVSQ